MAIIDGDNGNNTNLVGTSSADTIDGKGGNDIINGMGGEDTLIGGAGNDTFVYTAREFGRDTIVDFSTAANTDKIDLSALNVADFTTLSRFIGSDSLGNAVIKLGYGGSYEWITLQGVSRASLNASHFIFNTDPAGLTVDGETVYSDVLFGGNGADTLNGLSGDDTLTSGAGNDRLIGMGGDDTLIGGAGADRMEGGNSNDAYYVDNAGDQTIELSGQGSDTVYTAVGYTLDAGQHIEIFGTTSVAGTAAINLAGNELGQRISGNNGNNWIYGYAGNDILVGYGGADTMNGGAGNDTFYVDHASDAVVEAAGGGVDTVLTGVSYALAAGREIETLGTTSTAGTAAINLTGNSYGQRINGNNGNNVIYGGAGNDMLIGYGGNDNLDGQAGSDTLKGVSGIDKFVFRQSLLATANADHIADFGSDDFIYFDVTSGATGALNPNFFRVGANAVDADDRFIYYAPYKSLYYDPDGNGAATKVLFAVFDNGYTPTAADIVLF